MTHEKKIEHSQIQPGQCPPAGCPPPDRIECIVVDKVYDSCFQLDERGLDTEIRTTGAGSFSTGTFVVGTQLVCALQPEEDISCVEVRRVAVGGGFFTVTVLVTVPIRITNPFNALQFVDREITFTKNVTLCAPQGVNIDCSESTIVVCNCLVTAVPATGEPRILVTCDVQICVVIKAILTVQLLVPSYGFCVPAPCVTLPGVCPPLPPAQCF